MAQHDFPPRQISWRVNRAYDVIKIEGEVEEIPLEEWYAEMWLDQWTRAWLPDGPVLYPDRRKAKRAMNRYRKYRNAAHKRYNVVLPFHYD